MALEIRTVTDDELDGLRDAVMTTFGASAESDPEGTPRFRALVDPAQAWAAFDGATIVATAATFDLAIGLPGGASLPVAGLTMVSVRPTHRRRGLARALVRRHLDDARDRRYAASALWASEASIYQRFGYGIASFSDAIEVAHAHELTVAAGRDLDELAWLDPATARAVLPAIYARATADRPGALRRSDVWWRERRFLETAWARAGASERRHVLARRGAEDVGYLVYRQRGGFTNGVPTGRCEIDELIAVDPRAEATLWRLALGVDLFPTVAWWNAPTDHALPWLVANSRRIKRTRADNLWLRIEDVPAVLAARGYASDGVLRLAVEDTTWELTVAGGRGHGAVTAAAPDLWLDRPALAAIYLGGTTASQLARADVVRGDARALATADRLFASAVAPWCPEVF